MLGSKETANFDSSLPTLSPPRVRLHWSVKQLSDLQKCCARHARAVEPEVWRARSELGDDSMGRFCLSRRSLMLTLRNMNVMRGAVELEPARLCGPRTESFFDCGGQVLKMSLSTKRTCPLVASRSSTTVTVGSSSLKRVRLESAAGRFIRTDDSRTPAKSNNRLRQHQIDELNHVGETGLKVQ
jgi:hypothetical protein